MSSKPRFTREQLQSSSLELIDTEGLRAFSVRSLAAKLGTGPMTIYNYVRDRDELDALVADAVIAEMHQPRLRGDWQHDVRAIVTALWVVVRKHPNVIPLLLTRRSREEEAFAPVEALLQALASSGRSGKQLLVAFNTLKGFVFGLAQSHLAGPFSSELLPLPAQRFPRLGEMRKLSSSVDPEYEFRSGLDIVMAGLAGG
ncbi:MAG: TetR/AcrR family transcriptional regulator C-terminal domain-containing protein [Spirochaetia bacterium]|jgi:AcrR family transcriptional regulator